MGSDDPTWLQTQKAVESSRQQRDSHWARKRYVVPIENITVWTIYTLKHFVDYVSVFFKSFGRHIEVQLDRLLCRMYIWWWNRTTQMPSVASVTIIEDTDRPNIWRRALGSGLLDKGWVAWLVSLTSAMLWKTETFAETSWLSEWPTGFSLCRFCKPWFRTIHTTI